MVEFGGGDGRSWITRLNSEKNSGSLGGCLGGKGGGGEM